MGPDLLALFMFPWGGVDEETNEDAAPEVVLPKNFSCSFTEMLLMAPKELCASLAIVFS